MKKTYKSKGKREDYDSFSRKDYKKSYKRMSNSKWFKEAYVGKSVGETSYVE